MEDPTTASLLGITPVPKPPLKADFQDYVSLNFVDTTVEELAQSSQQLDTSTANERKNNIEGGITGRSSEEQGDDGANDHSNEGMDEVWRSSSVFTSTGWGLNDGKSCSSGGMVEGKTGDDRDNLAGHDNLSHHDNHNGHIYPRTLGTSVSVLDEKDAVERGGRARFVGEDPMKGRLRATDPFLWMGRLRARAAAFSSLIDNSDTTLKDLGVASISTSESSATDSPNPHLLGALSSPVRLHAVDSSLPAAASPAGGVAAPITRSDEIREDGIPRALHVADVAAGGGGAVMHAPTRVQEGRLVRSGVLEASFEEEDEEEQEEEDELEEQYAHDSGDTDVCQNSIRVSSSN